MEPPAMPQRPTDLPPTRRLLLATALALAGAAAVPAPAAAQSLDDLRRSGAVGERFDGYAVVRPGAPASTAAAVDRINAERADVYRRRAAEQGVAADAVGKVYAQQIIQNAPAGTWFLDPSGGWRQK